MQERSFLVQRERKKCQTSKERRDTRQANIQTANDRQVHSHSHSLISFHSFISFHCHASSIDRPSRNLIRRYFHYDLHLTVQSSLVQIDDEHEQQTNWTPTHEIMHEQLNMKWLVLWSEQNLWKKKNQLQKRQEGQEHLPYHHHLCDRLWCYNCYNSCCCSCLYC